MSREIVDDIKKSVPVCDILGVKVAAIDMDWLLEFTEKYIYDLSGQYICVSNVHTTVTAYDDPSYMAVQNGSIITLPDGGPLSTLGRQRGYSEMQRTTGPSYMQEILKISSEKGYKHFFYGSTDETLKKMQKKVLNENPDLQIVGSYSPPFRALTPEEDEKIISEINAARPDFVWIGLGAPKQEIWMADHKDRIPGLMVGVGAGFDYLADNIKRAPKWMQKYNLEWFYRLMQEPKRLFKRYLYTNTKFLWLAYVRHK